VHDRLVQVADAEIAVRMLGTDSIEKTNRLLARFVDLQLEDPASFQALHPRFLLHSDGNGDWITRYLLEAKYRLTLLLREGGRSLYFAER
jgi:hypothetical protein